MTADCGAGAGYGERRHWCSASWYGHTGDGNPPAAANAVVPASGTVRFDFSLVTR